jgi:hypothetical protein
VNEFHGELPDRLELFFGDASETVCRIYARLRGVPTASGLQLTGTLTGQFCEHAETLPATYSFRDCGAGASLLAEAIVPEPCFWTGAMPHQYQVQVQLLRDGQVVDRAERRMGLRLFGSHARVLYFEGQRWVLRGARRDELPSANLAAWRDAGLAIIVPSPDDELGRAASQTGVLLVAQLDDANAQEIERLARWAAVGMVVLPAGAMIDLAGLRHNLLLAEDFGATHPIIPSRWADVVICDVRQRNDLTNPLGACSLPIIASQVDGRAFASAAAARAGCDRVQGELANRGDLTSYEFSGYIV